MRMLRIAPFFLLGALAAAPATAQGIPDNIPDKPGESLADRHWDRMEERYRGLLSRFFSGGSFDVAPIAGPVYQLELGLGYTLETGDALTLHVGGRTVPAMIGARTASPAFGDGAFFGRLGYELSGTRFFGASPLGWRSALGLGVGVLSGTDLTAALFEVAPTYALIVRDSWSVPAGLRLSLATIDNRDPDATLTRAFLGIHFGVRWHWMHRDRLD